MKDVRSALAFTLMLAVSMSVTAAPAATAGKQGAAPAASFTRFDLATEGTHGGTAVSGSALTLGAGPLATGTYDDPHRDSGVIAFESGTWTSPWTASPFAYDELVASWNAATPPDTWIRVEMQGRGSDRTTKWYTLQVWASGDGDIRRTSVPAQGDGDGFIAIDTFVRSKKSLPLDEFQIAVHLIRKAGSSATPTVTFVGAMVSAASDFDIPSTFGGSGEVDLPVPTLSQETHVGHFPEYDNGGEAWCSPTSTAMVLRYWNAGPSAEALLEFPGSDPNGERHPDGDVDYAARYVYDWNYQGAGNWPNNTAYAATFATGGGVPLEGFVTRLRSLEEARLFLEAGIPLIASINGKLPGFLFDKTNGHLLVIRGLTASGDVITNDPAVWTNPEARKVYARADFESVWLEGSAGIVYVIRPTNVPLPANVDGLPPNW